MIGRWGMSEEIGPVDVRQSDEHPFLGREISQPRHFSDRTAATADAAVRALLIEAEQRASDLLARHQAQAEALIARLETAESLDRAAIAACLARRSASAGAAAQAAGG
jgi:cell division protease FtsH